MNPFELFGEIDRFNGLSPEEAGLTTVAELINSILYSPTMIGVQLLSLTIIIFLFTIWLKLVKKTGIWRERINEYREAFFEAPLPKAKLLMQWKEVEEKIESNDENQWKLAIIEADSILDEVIKALGYKGDTMGERMKNIKPAQFSRLEDAWRVHKVRNIIAHEPGYKLEYQTAVRAIEIYREIFKQFNLLD